MSAPSPAPARRSPSRGGDPVRSAAPATVAPQAQEHPLAGLHEAFGNLGVLQRLADPAIQAKLEVGAPDDAYEREADAIAARVMRGPGASPSTGDGDGAIRRRAEDDDKKKHAAPQRAAGAAAKAPAPRPPAPAPPKAAAPKAPDTPKVPAKGPAPMKPQAPAPPVVAGPKKTDAQAAAAVAADRKRDEPVVATKAMPGAVPSVSPAAARTIRSQQGAGQPLPATDRGFFESRLGRDLGSVRLHDDAPARAAARDIQAQAFTYGQDVYFGAGRYQPGTAGGRELLAHELAHTIQQRPGAPIERRVQRAPVGTAASGIVDWSQRLLTLPRLKVPDFKRGRYGQHLYDSGQSHPMRRNKDYAADTRPDQRADYRRVIATAQSEQILRGLATQPGAAGAFDPTKAYRWRTPHNQVRNYTVAQAAREWRIPPWGRADQRIDFEVDHIRELQLSDWPAASSAWANTRANWALLEDSANGTSGSRLRGYIAEATRDFIADPHALAARQEIPVIKDNPPASEVPRQASKLRGAINIEFTSSAPVGFTPAVTANEFWTVAEIESGAHLRRVRLDTLSPSPAANRVELFPLAEGGPSQLFNVGTSAPGAGSAQARLIAPLRITAANLTPGATARAADAQIGTITAVRPAGGSFKAGTPRQLTVRQLGTAARVGYIDRAQLQQHLQAIEIAALSPVAITELTVGNNGLHVSGRILSEVEPLRRANIQFALDGDDVRLFKQFSAGEVTVPRPLSISELSLTVFASTQHGIGFTGDVFFGIDKVGSGQLSATLSTADGLGFDGHFFFDAQMFNRAEIGIHYHQGRWSGDGVLEIGPGKLRGIKHAHFDVAYADEHLHATGTAEFDIEAVHSGEVHLDYDATHGLVIGGSAVIGRMPGIRGGNLAATIAQRPGETGYKLSATGTATAEVASFEAELAFDYDDGAFLAQATIPVHIGLINGSITFGATNRPIDETGHPVHNVPPLPQAAIFGAGSADIRITPWLHGIAGIRLLPNGEVQVSGSLIVPGVNLWDPITPDKVHLIRPPRLRFPIFGPVELTLGGGLNLEYGLGAGILMGSLGVEYNPAHEDQTHLHGEIHLHASAFAGIELEISVGIALDALVGSIEGDITLGAELRADAYVDTGIGVDWTPTSGFAFDATFAAHVEPKLVFDLSASVTASLLFWDKTWTKHLARKEFGSGLAVGVTLPVHYQEGQPFAIDWNRLDFQRPEIDPFETAKAFLEDLV